jgi:hypothetical protein
MVPLRRSTRQRRPPDRYQDFNLDELFSWIILRINLFLNISTVYKTN